MPDDCQPAPAAPPLTRAEREAMLAEADHIIKPFVLRSGVHKSQREDVMQDCRLAIWQVMDRFDPARGVAWTTFVGGVVKRTVMRSLCDPQSGGAEGSSGRPCQLYDAAAEHVPDRDTEHEIDGDEERDETAVYGELSAAVRRQLAEPLLAKLTPGHRRLVEIVAFDGLTPDQAADQLGQPVKVVKVNLQNAVKKMLGQPINGGANPDPDTVAAKELLRELAALCPAWTVKKLHAELQDYLGHSTVDKVVRQVRGRRYGGRIPKPS